MTNTTFLMTIQDLIHQGELTLNSPVTIKDVYNERQAGLCYRDEHGDIHLKGTVHDYLLLTLRDLKINIPWDCMSNIFTVSSNDGDAYQQVDGVYADRGALVVEHY